MEHRVSQDGFTLIEILIAIALVAIMGAIAAPFVLKRFEAGKRNATVVQLKSLKAALEHYYIDVGQYPETLRDLVKEPSNEEAKARWQGPYLEAKDTPQDGWSRKIQYKLTGEGEHPYDLYSYGPKGSSASKSEWLDVWKAK